ncbi:inner membrane protein YhjD [Rhodococcus spongiicola]|uniref:Inner membrane protein YhjD n=1 Tax=Rhodococcus spongiicola TaxID=2487352 RepID=A0A3S3B6U2_9NOCA|nr:inner membrane protein YhjD [Rhodococcus spongiicola]RVW04509.1 inner membrane protein YhjD [Rhodococcus spongiicola]
MAGAAPSFLDRQRAARPWVDHLVRAGRRYQQQQGNHYAAGITFFTILAIVPILMVAFAVVGFVLAGRPEVLTEIQDQVSTSMPGGLGDTVNDLIDSAISSRAGVGVVGFLGATYAGLAWMANLRDALTAMWEHTRKEHGLVVTKLRDFVKLVGLGLALIVTFGLSALSNGPVAQRVVEWLGVENALAGGVLLRITSVVVALLATWGLLTWVIARLPREPVTLRSAMRAAFAAAIVFELFRQVGAIYLNAVSQGPAGVAFGPIIGLLVFSNLAARLVLFATAWAATARENVEQAFVPPPDSAVIQPRVQVREGVSVKEAVILTGAGALAAIGLAGLWRRRAQ